MPPLSSPISAILNEGIVQAWRLYLSRCSRKIRKRLKSSFKIFPFAATGSPYLPLWQHLPQVVRGNSGNFTMNFLKIIINSMRKNFSRLPMDSNSIKINLKKTDKIPSCWRSSSMISTKALKLALIRFPQCLSMEEG